MREIKFRAWDEESKEMIFSDDDTGENFFSFYDGKMVAAVIEEVTSGSDCEPDYNTSRELGVVMQFTGLRDRTGVEIYEGDIVKNSQCPGSSIMVVKYYGGGFDPFAIPNWECSADPNESEVIGNIYENPELLAAVKEV